MLCLQAFCNHPGALELAIENYHKALGLKAEDNFTVEMLTTALEDCAKISELELGDM